MSLRLDGVTYRYPGTSENALNGVTLTAQRGRVLAVLGPNEAGKSTLLRVLAGLEEPNSGTIAFDDEGVVDSEYLRNNVAMIFQNYALMPNLTIEQNISAYALGVDKAHLRDQVGRVAEILGLSDVLSKSARELAPSQRMRVAFARGLIRGPRLLLLDEPLAHLDLGVSQELRADLAAAIRSQGITTVLATSDETEARDVGDDIIWLDRGQARDSAEPLVAPPAAGDEDEGVNVLPATVDARGRVSLGVVDLGLQVPAGEGRVHALVRSSDLVVTAAEEGFALVVQEALPVDGGTRINGRVRLAEGRRPMRVTVDVPGQLRPQVGETLAVAPRPGSVTLVDRESGNQLPTMSIEA